MAGKFLFVGAAGGFLEPILGCGQGGAIHSGVMAAREIVCSDGSLTRYARRWTRYYQRLLALRRWLNAQDVKPEPGLQAPR